MIKNLILIIAFIFPFNNYLYGKGVLRYVDRDGYTKKTEYIDGNIENIIKGLNKLGKAYNIINNTYDNFLVEVSYNSYILGLRAYTILEEASKASYDYGNLTGKYIKKWLIEIKNNRRKY